MLINFILPQGSAIAFKHLVRWLKQMNSVFYANSTDIADRYRNCQFMYVQWTSYQIREIVGCACAGNTGNVFLATDIKGNHGLAIPACIAARASRTCRDVCRDRQTAVAKNMFPAFQAHAQPAILRIWQEAHATITIHSWVCEPITYENSSFVENINWLTFVNVFLSNQWPYPTHSGDKTTAKISPVVSSDINAIAVNPVFYEVLRTTEASSLKLI